MTAPYTAYRFTACHVLPSFARQRPLLRDFLTDLQKIVAFFLFPPCPSNGVLIPLVVQGEIVRKNVWYSCTSVLERERSTFVSDRKVPLPPHFRRCQPFTDVSNQFVPEERAVGCLAAFRYLNFPSFSHVLSTSATALWISLSSHLFPPSPRC